MAGNTRLRGFAPNHKVQLERWGERVMVQLTEFGYEGLMDACKEKLPKEPPLPNPVERELFDSDFVEETGAIFVRLNLEGAKVLEDVIDSHQDELGEERSKHWLSEIGSAIDRYKDYWDTDEPGIE